MTDEAGDDERQRHRSLAVAANNSTWELLAGASERDVPALDLDRTFDLLGRAYAAAYHWRMVTGPESVNVARAAWLCSRCHAAVGDGDAALRTAELCSTITGSIDDAADFDHFYAAEARARALACLGRSDEAAVVFRKAEALLNQVADSEDREIASGDFAAGPWFGLRELLDDSG